MEGRTKSDHDELKGMSHFGGQYDNRPCFGYIDTRISLIEDAFGRGYSPMVERVRCLRAGPYTLSSGSFGHQSPGTMTGAGGAPLGWDRRRRVTPAQTASQETWPEAEP